MMNGCDEMILAIIFIGRLRTLLAHFVSGFLVDVMIRPGRAVIWRLLCRASTEGFQSFHNLLVESTLTEAKVTKEGRTGRVVNIDSYI